MEYYRSKNMRVLDLFSYQILLVLLPTAGPAAAMSVGDGFYHSRAVNYTITAEGPGGRTGASVVDKCNTFLQKWFDLAQ